MGYLDNIGLKRKQRDRIEGGCILTVFIILILGILAYTTFYSGYPWTWNNVAKIERRYHEFHYLLDSEKHEEAYAYMSPAYRQTNSYSDFLEEGIFDDFYPMDSKRIIWIRDKKAKVFVGYWDYYFPSGPEYEMIEVEGFWYFTGGCEWYYD